MSRSIYSNVAVVGHVKHYIELDIIKKYFDLVVINAVSFDGLNLIGESIDVLLIKVSIYFQRMD